MVLVLFDWADMCYEVSHSAAVGWRMFAICEQVCREYQRGVCTRTQSECRYAHPPNGMAVDADNYVTVCMDFIKGRCHRETCRYFHPPPHLQAQIKTSQQRAIVSCTVLFLLHTWDYNVFLARALAQTYEPDLICKYFTWKVRVTYIYASVTWQCQQRHCVLGCTIVLSVHPVRCCYHGISWMAQTIFIKLTGNIDQSILMTLEVKAGCWGQILWTPYLMESIMKLTGNNHYTYWWPD